MPNPILYATNVLEGAILTATDPVPGKGPERVVDRDIGLECEDNGTTGARVWHADRGVGAAATSVNAWLFAGSHYAGQLVTLQSSTDDAAWTTRGTITPASDIPQRVTLTPFAAPRYLRWTLTSPPAPVRFTEVFVSPGVSLTFPPTAQHTSESQSPNTVLVASQSGRTWGIQRGARRWSTTYSLVAAPETDRLALLGLLDVLADGVKPCWIVTVKGELKWARITGAVTLPSAPGLPIANYAIPLAFTEELP